VIPCAVVIEVVLRCPEWRQSLGYSKQTARDAARLALAEGLANAATVPPQRIELSVVLTDDAEQRRLNRDWRGIDRSTNVLAFPVWNPEAAWPAEAPLLLGDVVLAYETVTREARDQRKSFADHFRHLVVHGVLHLLGYDHATGPEAVLMERLETSILEGLGVADPYRDIM
jgi:probable rRNA maturation factor